MNDERKILNDCEVVTMDKFINCLCKQNYSCLVVSGEFSDNEKFEAWQDIFYQYCDLLNTNEYKIMLKLMKSIGINEAKLIAINLCLIVLSHNYNQECIDILKKYGYNYAYNFDDKEQYLKDLQNVQSINKGVKMNLLNDEKNLERLTDKKKKQVRASDFDEIFISLNSRLKFGFKITKQNTTIAEYCSMINVINKK
jgi:hypothetical protein